MLWLVGEEMWTRWEGWEAIERGKACVAAIGIGELDRRICGARRVALGVL